jgi:hypothetical protein
MRRGAVRRWSLVGLAVLVGGGLLAVALVSRAAVDAGLGSATCLPATTNRSDLGTPWVVGGLVDSGLAGGGSTGTALVVGDSVVAVAALADQARTGIRLRGYAGEEPCAYTTGQMTADWEAADRPKTVVLNWNGNNPRGLAGTALVAAYRQDLARDITWYLARGVTHVVLAAAVPSVFNNAANNVAWTDPAAARPGWMLGSPHLNDLYRDLARRFAGRVLYSEAAARAIHPGMAFNTTLNGQACIADYIHETPYCAKIYADALNSLAGGAE